MAVTTREKHALVEAASAFDGRGIDFRMPWECDLDDLERERYEALVEACRAYAKVMNGDTLPGTLESRL